MSDAQLNPKFDIAWDPQSAALRVARDDATVPLQVELDPDGNLITPTGAGSGHLFLALDAGGELAAISQAGSQGQLVAGADGSLRVSSAAGGEPRPARLLLVGPDHRLRQWQPGMAGLPVSLIVNPQSHVAGLAMPAPSRPRAASWSQRPVLAVAALAAVAVIVALLALLVLGGGDESGDQAAAAQPSSTASRAAAVAVQSSATATVGARSSPSAVSASATATSEPVATVTPAGLAPLPTATVPSTRVVATAAPSATPQPPPSVPELITAALPGYVAAVRSGDGSYFYAHLHPIVTQFYGAATCQGFFGALAADPTFAIQVSQITGPGSWTWQIYGETVGTVPDAYTLSVTLTQQGQTVQAQAHFGWDGQLLVFSPCRRPPGQ